jgi:hypothetical protein
MQRSEENPDAFIGVSPSLVICADDRSPASEADASRVDEGLGL